MKTITRLLRVTSTITFALTLAAVAGAQPQTPTAFRLLDPENPLFFGQIDFGGRLTNVTGDEARYQRYRDLRDGLFVDVPFLHVEKNRWWMNLTVQNTGYNDQRYALTYARPGRVKFSFFYDQTPTFISNDTKTPYSPRPGSNGVYDDPRAALTLPDDVQARIQSDPSLAREEIESLATGFPSRIRRDTLGFNLTVDFTENWQTKFKYLNTKKQGNIPWGASFGFNLPIEIPLPIDTRTDDLAGSLEWRNNRGMLRVGYEGSWFEQQAPVYVWDNPVRLTDQTHSRAYVAGDGTSRGRGAQWPSNSFYYVNLAGAYRPAPRTRVHGTLSLGQSQQNDTLLPHTINSAIPPLDSTTSLARRSAEAKANIGAGTLNVVTRPTRNFSVNGRYRFTRFDNTTPHFAREEYVRFDQVEEEGGPPLLLGYTRNTLDVDAAYRAPAYTTFRVGYGYNGADFTERIYFQSNENTLRASVDTVGNQYLTFRSLYEHSQRRGDGFHAGVLEHAAEQPGMRHFDIADRDRDKLMFMSNLLATSDMSVNASVAWTKDSFLNPEQPRENSFGLLSYKTQTYSIGADYIPGDAVGIGASYNFDRYDGLSQSRNASPGPQFDDPDRNWTTDEAQKGHSFLAYVEFPELARNAELRVDYDYSKYNGLYLYDVGPAYTPSPSEPGGIGQLPAITSNEHRISVDLRYFLRSNVAIGVAYWYDDYEVSDFTLGPTGESFSSGVARPPIFEDQPVDSAINGVVLNYFYRPYTSHTGWLRLTYLF